MNTLFTKALLIFCCIGITVPSYPAVAREKNEVVVSKTSKYPKTKAAAWTTGAAGFGISSVSLLTIGLLFGLVSHALFEQANKIDTTKEPITGHAEQFVKSLFAIMFGTGSVISLTTGTVFGVITIPLAIKSHKAIEEAKRRDNVLAGKQS